MNHSNHARPSHSRPAGSPLALLLILISLLSAGMASCNIVGPVMVLAQGPPKTEAQVRLDTGRVHLILVDDMRSRLPKRSLRDQIAQGAEESLLEEGVLRPENLIGARAVQRAMSDDRSGSPKSIADIGRDAGAGVVIYLTIDSWGLTRDGRSAAPAAEGRVKVIDCETNKRLWPPNDTGYRLRVAPTMQQGDLPADNAARARLEQDLARRLGTSLAQLFYKHETSKSATK